MKIEPIKIKDLPNYKSTYVLYMDSDVYFEKIESMYGPFTDTFTKDWIHLFLLSKDEFEKYDNIFVYYVSYDVFEVDLNKKETADLMSELYESDLIKIKHGINLNDKIVYKTHRK